MKTIDQITYTGLIDRSSKTNGCRPMSKKESEMFIRLSLVERQRKKYGDAFTAEMMQELERDFSFRVLKQRLGWAGFARDTVVTPEAVLLLLTQDCIENPAQLVLWAYTLLYIHASEKEVVDINLLAQWFPYGFPTPERYHEIWDKQKGHELKVENCDNFIDRPDWWRELAEVINSPRHQATVDASDIVEVDSEDELPTDDHEA